MTVTTFTWTAAAGSGVSGDWLTASDWTTAGGPPNAATAAALINAPGTYVVSIGTETVSVNSVTLASAGADISITSAGTLALTGTAPNLHLNAGTLDLAGVLSGGTVVASGGTALFESTPTLQGVTWMGPMTFGTTSAVSVLGGLQVQTLTGQPGTIDMTAGNSALFVLDSETLNNMTVAFDGSGGGLLANYNTSGGTLTLGACFTIAQSGAYNQLLNEFNGLIVDAGVIAVNGGELQVQFGAFTNSGSISITGGGTVDVSLTTLTNTGTMTVGPSGTLILGTIASDTGTMTIASAGTIEFNVGGTAAVAFTGTGGALKFDQNTGNAGTVSGFAPGDTILFTGLGYAANITPTLTAGNVLNLIQTGTTVASVALNTATSYKGDTFHVVSAAAGTETAITVSVACFAAGTAIDTADGERTVETLRAGDRLPTLLGGGGTVVWVGHRRVDCARHPDPEAVMPIRVAKDAFGPGQPRRELFLSPDHAVYVDGVLVPVRLLINGTTIRQVLRPSVVYYHVELEQHDVLLAEGLAAESYLDTGNRGMFANGEAPVVAHPDFDAGADRREVGSCARFVCRPDDVEPIWRKLADRAASLGWADPAPDAFDEDPDLHIRLGTRRLNPIDRTNGRYCFVLPPGAEAPVLVSHAARPSASRPWIDDRRTLGVRVRGITLRSPSGHKVLSLDDASLSEGWWGVETSAGAPCRWTAGAASMPRLPSGILEIEIDGVVPYPIRAGARRAVA